MPGIVPQGRVFPADGRLITDQRDLIQARQGLRRLDRSSDNFTGSKIPAHGIYGNMHNQLLGNDRQDLPSFVVTTRRTHPVRLMRFAAVRTCLRRRQCCFMGPLANANPAF